jgi:REP element-mobilizing transposase RayT
VARPLRILFPGALYHLIVRGNNRERCFLGEPDFLLFLEVLEQVLERFSWLLYAYCLMDNHYHLEAETPLPNLPSGMRQLNGLYTQRFNRRHRRCGHLFQARYRSILIERETHLRETARYVVLNPVRAGICEHPGDYRWSSYRATVGEAKPEVSLALAPLLELFSNDPVRARARYREFVEEGIARRSSSASGASAWAATSSCASASATSRRCRRSRASRSSRCRPTSRSSSRAKSCRSLSPTAITATRSARSPTSSAATTQPSAGGCGGRKS